MISLYCKLLFNLMRNILLKIRYGSRFKAHFIERISSKASISLYEKGSVNFARNIELAPYVDVQVHGDGRLSIGSNTYMNRYCMISCHGKVEIGEKCMFGPSVKIFDNNHRFNKDHGVLSDLSVGSITIGDNCWIASDVIILKGAKIGNNCVIGAGCIIDFEVRANHIVRLKQTQCIEVISK